MNKIKDGTMTGVSKVGDGFGYIADATTAPFKPGVPVVEAREEDWEKMPTGQERALAYQREQQRKRGFWIFRGPVDFKEPELPDGSEAVMDSGLLPPKN